MRISAPRSSGPLVRGGRIKRRILGDVPGVAQRGGSIFPRRATSTCPLALPPELDVGRSVGPARSAGRRFSRFYQAALTFRVRTARALAARATILSPFRSRSPGDRSIPLSDSPRINRADSSRERYL